MPSVFDEEIRARKKWKQSKVLSRQFAEFRRIWKARGPVKFAEEILKKDPITGRPLRLSDDQKEFLLDVGKRGVRLAIIVAGRGAGKTFSLAVYIMWRIYTHENWWISCMGGSREQSEKIHSYIAGWINNNPTLETYCLKCTLSEIKTHANSGATFHACSGTSIRGPHTCELIIDEQAAAEEQGKTKFIRAALWEVSTSPDIKIIKSSTAHFVHGDFLHTWNNADKLGYKRYRWSIARHKSGEKDPYKIYQDTNPDNWESNVPWIPDENIRILRNEMSNDEWLVEALGGVSISSGLVFNPLDVDLCICDYCVRHGKECKPYKEGYCPLLHMALELMGVDEEKFANLSIKQIIAKFMRVRAEGIDWGRVSPSAYTVVGKIRNMAFVLDSEEVTGISDDEKIQKAIKKAKKWNVEVVRPDPREWALNNRIAEAGFAVHELFSGSEGGSAKYEYLHTVKRYIERHLLRIPCAFEDLIRSLKNLSYTKEGKIRKVDDHSFDSLMYAISYFDEIVFLEEEEIPKRKSKSDRKEDKEKDYLTKYEEMKKRRLLGLDEDVGEESENEWQGLDLWGE